MGAYEKAEGGCQQVLAGLLAVWLLGRSSTYVGEKSYLSPTIAYLNGGDNICIDLFKAMDLRGQ